MSEATRVFQKLEGVEFRYDYVELPESLKFAGVSGEGEDLPEFKRYHEQEYRKLIGHQFEPYTEIRLWSNVTSDKGEWIYGCLVTSLANLPKGVRGADTGWTRFVVMTLRDESVEKLLNGSSIGWGHGNVGKYMPEEYRDQVLPPAPGEWRGYSTIAPGQAKIGSTSNVEIYPETLSQGVPEMSFYIPLKPV